MKHATKKWVLAGAVALTSGAGEIFMRMASGEAANWTAAMVVGVVMGIVTRGVGATLAAMASSEDDESEG